MAIPPKNTIKQKGLSNYYDYINKTYSGLNMPADMFEKIMTGNLDESTNTFYNNYFANMYGKDPEHVKRTTDASIYNDPNAYGIQQLSQLEGEDLNNYIAKVDPYAEGVLIDYAPGYKGPKKNYANELPDADRSRYNDAMFFSTFNQAKERKKLNEPMQFDVAPTTANEIITAPLTEEAKYNTTVENPVVTTTNVTQNNNTNPDGSNQVINNTGTTTTPNPVVVANPYLSPQEEIVNRIVQGNTNINPVQKQELPVQKESEKPLISFDRDGNIVNLPFGVDVLNDKFETTNLPLGKEQDNIYSTAIPLGNNATQQNNKPISTESVNINPQSNNPTTNVTAGTNNNPVDKTVNQGLMSTENIANNPPNKFPYLPTETNTNQGNPFLSIRNQSTLQPSANPPFLPQGQQIAQPNANVTLDKGNTSIVTLSKDQDLNMPIYGGPEYKPDTPEASEIKNKLSQMFPQSKGEEIILDEKQLPNPDTRPIVENQNKPTNIIQEAIKNAVVQGGGQPTSNINTEGVDPLALLDRSGFYNQKQGMDYTLPTMPGVTPKTTTTSEGVITSKDNTKEDNMKKDKSQFTPKDYYLAKGLLDTVALFNNMIQPPPPGIQMKLPHQERMRLDRTPYELQRTLAKEAQTQSNRAMREGMSQASQLMAGTSASQATTQDALRQVGAQEAQAMQTVDQMNQQIANQENMAQTEMLNKESIANYEIQAKAKEMKDANINKQLEQVGNTMGAYAAYMHSKDLSDKMSKNMKQQADMSNKLQLAMLEHEMTKKELDSDAYKESEKKIVNDYIKANKNTLLEDPKYSKLKEKYGENYDPTNITAREQSYLTNKNSAETFSNQFNNFKEAPKEPAQIVKGEKETDEEFKLRDEKYKKDLESHKEDVEEYNLAKKMYDKRVIELQEMKDLLDTEKKFEQDIVGTYNIGEQKKNFQSTWLKERGLPENKDILQTVKDMIESYRQM